MLLPGKLPVLPGVPGVRHGGLDDPPCLLFGDLLGEKKGEEKGEEVGEETGEKTGVEAGGEAMK